MKRYKSPFLENEKRTKPDSDRRIRNRQDQSNDPLWGELIKELGPEIKKFLITTAENHKRMTDAEERKASVEERMSESIVGMVEHFKAEIKLIAAAPVRKKHAKNNDKHHRKVKQIILNDARK